MKSLFFQNYRGLAIWVITFAICIAQRFLPSLIMTIIVLTTALLSFVPFQRNTTDLGTTVHTSGRGTARRAGAKVLDRGEGPTLHGRFSASRTGGKKAHGGLRVNLRRAQSQP